MNFAGKIIMGIAMFFMPIGLILAMQGNYFYTITSRDTVNALIDNVIEEQFQSQMGQYQELCRAYLNKGCSNISEVKTLVCKKNNELKEQYINKSNELCSYFNATCHTIEDVVDIVCSRFGTDSDACLQSETAKQRFDQIDNMCTQLGSLDSKIEAQKNELYNKEVFNGISLSKMNSVFAIALPIGVIIFVVSVVLVYIASRSFVTLSNSVFVTILSTGILFLILWYFGNTMLGNIIPAEIAEHMPNALNSFIREIFQFEYLNGLVLSVIGAVGFAITMAVKKIKK